MAMLRPRRVKAAKEAVKVRASLRTRVPKCEGPGAPGFLVTLAERSISSGR